MKKKLNHLACIMDGNRRWAKQRGLLGWYGHHEGVKALKTVINFCLEEGINYLSLYTFSLENFKRSDTEKRYLFSYLARQAKKELPLFIEKGVRVRFVGDRNYFPQSLRSMCADIERETANGQYLLLNLLFCYGGRQELVAGIKDLIRDVKAENLSEKDITEEQLNDYLWMGAIPAPDLIIRTGGMQRLSNFLVYQSAYSELLFLECMWPDLSREQLEKAVSSFRKSKRNFGV